MERARISASRMGAEPLPSRPGGDTQSNRVSPYSPEFFRSNRESGLRSAGVVIPLLLKLLSPFRPQSVVDLGCGAGGWVATWLSHGITDVLGIDGDYVDKSAMVIPTSNFLALDLTLPVKLNRKFDLAVSLEVGEELPPESSDTLVESLIGLSPLVLFSAAVPHQEGRNHVNEQWPEYWVQRFRARGYAVADLLRSRLWNNDTVNYYYAQNILLFVRRDRLSDYPTLVGKVLEDALLLVHPKNYLYKVELLKENMDLLERLKAYDVRNLSLRVLLSLVPTKVATAIKRRFVRGDQSRW